ncbi:MAG: FG-GAP repeat protein, partial [Deltaproteobacteria bacterium]|nr:FG-GAP repeat protein [Deltaproteobacteria bacterium]
GDGYADVIAGAIGFDAGESDEGAAFVFLGSASGIANGNPTTAAAQLESDQVDAVLGWSVAGAGDVNGDGYADVIVGAPSYDSGQTDEGAAFVFLGSGSGIADGNPATADAQLEANQASSFLGKSVSGAGDVNSDGYADVIVGAELHNSGSNDEGAAFVYLGSATGIADGNPGSAAAKLEANQVSANLGASVAAAGDVNGDGYADVIVGAPFYTKAQSSEGVALVFLGNGDGGARPVLVQQLRGDGSDTPVEPWGHSYEVDSFAVRVQATDPEGRGRVKLEVEACASSLPFGDASCVQHMGASWTDVTATSGGVAVTETISGLTEDVLYRWRARVLYAPYSVTQVGITPPPNPAHGTWLRVSAQATEADIRVVPEPCLELSLAAGALLIALGDRRRWHRRMRARGETPAGESVNRAQAGTLAAR